MRSFFKIVTVPRDEWHRSADWNIVHAKNKLDSRYDKFQNNGGDYVIYDW